MKMIIIIIIIMIIMMMMMMIISPGFNTFLFLEIGRLENLKVLEIMNNKLLKLPDGLPQCGNLTRLLVDRNSLQWLPNHLCDMAKLQEVSAVGNKLLCLPIGKHLDS